MSFLPEQKLVRDNLSRQSIVVLLAVFFIALLTFVWIMVNVIDSGKFLPIDTLLVNSLYENRTSTVSYFFLGVTFFGSALFVIISAIIFSAYSLFKKRVEFLAILITLTGTHETVSILKPIINRSRPDFNLAYYIENSLSFPSGHSAIAVALFGYYIYYLLKIDTLCKPRIVVLLSGATIILLIGFSRMYLGVHYLSDVLGGFLIGLLWLIIGIIVTEVVIHKKEALVLRIKKCLRTIKATK